jgi:hypothetical protein
MKKIILITLCGVYFCKAPSSKDLNQDRDLVVSENIILCDSNYLNKKLYNEAIKYTPRSIDVESSVNDELKKIILSTDKKCLNKTKMYKFLVVSVYLKQYLHHLKYYKGWGYDLMQMYGKVETQLFGELMSVCQIHGQEGFSSSSILECVEKNPSLIEDNYLKGIMDSIDKIRK